MNWLKNVRKWPVEKKRIFSIILALFFTFLIIILNSGLSLIWKDDEKNIVINNNSVSTIQESLSKIIEQTKPILDQALSSSTDYDNIIDQTNSTSSSFSTTSNVVE